MKVSWDQDAWEDYLFWQGEDPKVTAKINGLIKECLRDPFRGTGKPEPLGKNMAGWWSRRIDREHRLVYRLIGKDDAQALEIIQCRYHY